MSDTTDECQANPSELGTHAHWEQTYQREMANLAAHGDPGEVW